MARSANKRGGRVLQTLLKPEAGIDYSRSAIDTPGNALRLSINGHYMPGSALWRTRPPVECVLEETDVFADPVRLIRPFFDGTNVYMMAVSGTNIFHCEQSVLEASGATFTQIGTDEISSATVKPGTLSYNQKFYIADGDTALKLWSGGGSSITTILNGPTKPTCLVEARNRLFINSTDEPDAVYITAAEWTTNDFTASGAGIILRGGYGDGLDVTSMSIGPGGNDVIVSKSKADLGAKLFRRINVQDVDPTNWSVSDAFGVGYAAQANPYSMLPVYNDVVFFSDNGLYGLAGVQEYGDINVNQWGDKINSLIRVVGAIECQEIVYSPIFGAVFILLKNRTKIYVYTPWNGAFVEWEIGGGEIINSICTIGNYIYLASEDGRIYKMAPDFIGSTRSASDEVSKDSFTEYTSQLRGKKLYFGGYDGAIFRAALSYTPITGGMATLQAVLDDEATTVKLRDITVPDGSYRIGGDFASTERIGGTYASTTLIGTVSVSLSSVFARGGPRSRGLMLQVTTSGGARIAVDGIAVELTAPIGG